MTQLFPGDSGAVFVLSASRDMLEAAAVWGPLPPANPIFPPNECWALRRGQVHLAVGHERRCPHVSDDGHMYTCLPLLAQGETLGILHVLDGPVKNDEADEARMAEKGKLAKILADNIGLGIANLKLRESMRNLSIRDPLTGLFNRRYMEEAMALELHRTRRNHAQLAVIMVDIDHFKQFNDNFGHDGGDAILCALGAFFKATVRTSDIASARRENSGGRQAAESDPCQPGPGRHHAVDGGGHVPRPGARHGGACQGGRPRALPGQTRRAQSGSHVRDKRAWVKRTAAIGRGHPMSAAGPRPRRSVLQTAPLRDAAVLRAVCACAGRLGAAALSPLGGTARSAKGVQ